MISKCRHMNTYLNYAHILVLLETNKYVLHSSSESQVQSSCMNQECFLIQL